MVARWGHHKGAGDFGVMDATAPDRRGDRRRIQSLTSYTRSVHAAVMCHGHLRIAVAMETVTLSPLLTLERFECQDLRVGLAGAPQRSAQ